MCVIYNLFLPFFQQCYKFSFTYWLHDCFFYWLIYSGQYITVNHSTSWALNGCSFCTSTLFRRLLRTSYLWETCFCKVSSSKSTCHLNNIFAGHLLSVFLHHQSSGCLSVQVSLFASQDKQAEFILFVCFVLYHSLHDNLYAFLIKCCISF